MKHRARPLVSVFLFALAAVAVPLVQPASAAGATIKVTIPTDTVAPDGKCSLREALQAADTNAAFNGCSAGSITGSDTIAFATSINGQVIHLGSSLDVDSNVIIKGNGRSKTQIANFDFNTINGTSTFEHLTLVDVNNEDATTTLLDIHATSNNTNNNSTGTEKSIMTIRNSTVGDLNNNSGFGTSLTKLTIVNSKTGMIDNNSGSGTTSALVVSKSKTGEIDNNSGSADGSVTTATIKNTSVTGTGSSSGIDDTSDGTSVLISGTTITKFDTGVTNDGKSTKIVNSTITGNKTSTVENDSGQTTVLNSTLTKGVTGILQSGGTVKATNTIIANQSGKNCIGTVGSGGGNISDDGSCHFAHSHDHNNKNPKLGTLGAHGGPTKTFVPLTGSPAIDGGLNAPCPPTDQRGKKRPQDGDGNGSKICDVGSVEVVP